MNVLSRVKGCFEQQEKLWLVDSGHGQRESRRDGRVETTKGEWGERSLTM